MRGRAIVREATVYVLWSSDEEDGGVVDVDIVVVAIPAL
jgi:hypothetical protein